MTGFLLNVITMLLFNSLDTNFQFQLFTCYLVISLVVYTQMFASKETYKLAIMLWLIGLIVAMNLQWFLWSISWIRFVIQCVMAFILSVTYYNFKVHK